jgi:hypothetical protein
MKQLIKPGKMLLWSIPIAFSLHLADETLANGGIVQGV